MSEKRKWKGIRTNMVMFQGEITSAPVENQGHHFMTLETAVVQRDANGQFTELDQAVPIMIEPGGPVGVVQHIMKGRKLLVRGHYKSWSVNGALNHAFVAEKIDLGDKPFEPKPDGGDIPSLPTY